MKERADFLCVSPEGRVRAKSRRCREAEIMSGGEGPPGLLSWEEVALPVSGLGDHLLGRWGKDLESGWQGGCLTDSSLF